MERYENLGVVGEGSYGLVIRCRNRESGQVVAIKKFLESDDDANVRKIALREVRMLQKLRHENLVNLIEHFRKKRRLYLVFEFVDHTVLDELEKSDGGLDPEVSRRYIFQVIRGIYFCHQNQIIHRDVKPENVLISKLGVVKLCDFGFARLLANPGETCTDYVATRWYRAPELLVGETRYGKEVDIWAIGCLLAEMLTAEPLFPGESDIDQLFHIIQTLGELTAPLQASVERNPMLLGLKLPQGATVPLSSLFPKWDTRVLSFVSTCLNMDPQLRPSAQSLLANDYFTHDSFPETFLPELRDKVQKEFESGSVYPSQNSMRGIAPMVTSKITHRGADKGNPNTEGMTYVKSKIPVRTNAPVPRLPPHMPSTFQSPQAFLPTASSRTLPGPPFISYKGEHNLEDDTLASSLSSILPLKDTAPSVPYCNFPFSPAVSSSANTLSQCTGPGSHRGAGNGAVSHLNFDSNMGPVNLHLVTSPRRQSKDEKIQHSPLSLWNPSSKNKSSVYPHSFIASESSTEPVSNGFDDMFSPTPVCTSLEKPYPFPKKSFELSKHPYAISLDMTKEFVEKSSKRDPLREIRDNGRARENNPCARDSQDQLKPYIPSSFSSYLNSRKRTEAPSWVKPRLNNVDLCLPDVTGTPGSPKKVDFLDLGNPASFLSGTLDKSTTNMGRRQRTESYVAKEEIEDRRTALHCPPVGAYQMSSASSSDCTPPISPFSSFPFI